MVRLRPYLEEITRALLVLALVVFNLSHLSPPAIAFDGFGYTAAAVYCGSPDSDQQLGHAPCHACRPGGEALLPPPPCAATAAPRAMDVVVYRAVPLPAPDDLHGPANRSRGPPQFA